MEVERRKAKLLTTQLSVLSSKRRTHEGLDALVGLSVDAILSGELARPIKPQQQTNTLTLLDIISNEESGAAYRGLAELNGTGKHKKKSSKKSIKDKLKFCKHGSSWSASSSVPTSDLPSNNKKNRRIEQISDPVLVDRPLLASLSLRSSIKLLDDCQNSDLKSKSDSSSDDDDDDGEKNVNTTTHEEKEKLEKPESEIHTESSESLVDDENVPGPLITEPDEDEKRENEDGPLISESMMEAGAPTVSLMALLEESGRRVDDDDEDDEDDDEEEDEETGVEYICTVCMVKHRRLAFVPCGHTFCSLCSKELWVSRGNCPLCTGYILEILDIF